MRYPRWRIDIFIVQLGSSLALRMVDLVLEDTVQALELLAGLDVFGFEFPHATGHLDPAHLNRTVAALLDQLVLVQFDQVYAALDIEVLDQLVVVDRRLAAVALVCPQDVLKA